MTRSIAAVTFLLTSILTMACSGPPPTVVSKGEPGSAPSGAAAPMSMPQATSVPGDLSYKAPDGWTSETTASGMRVAQYKLPKAAGDADDASLVLYYFGPGQGGSVQANLDRWMSQVEQPDGSSSKDKSKTESMTVNGLKVTLLDVSGTYTAEMMPGQGDRQNKTGYRMRAAVIETPKGPYFIKLVGPQQTIARWDEGFLAYVKSFQFKG